MHSLCQLDSRVYRSLNRVGFTSTVSFRLLSNHLTTGDDDGFTKRRHTDLTPGKRRYNVLIFISISAHHHQAGVFTKLQQLDLTELLTRRHSRVTQISRPDLYFSHIALPINQWLRRSRRTQLYACVQLQQR